MSVTWESFGDEYGYVTSDDGGTLGEQFRIDIYMQYNDICNIYAKLRDDDSEDLIYSGYGGTTTYWTPPLSAASSVTNSRFATYTLRYEFIESDTGKSYQRGSYTKSFVIPIYPTIASCELTDSSGYLSIFGKYISGLSKLQITLTTTIDSSYGAPMSKASVYINGKWLQMPSFVINEDRSYTFTMTVSALEVGNQKIQVYVYDTRGAYASESQTISVLDYSPPAVEITTPYRCNADGEPIYNGPYACVALNATASSLDNQNTLSAKVTRIETSTGSLAYSDEYAADDTLTITDEKIIFQVSGDEGYTIYGQCWDRINTRVSINKILPKIQPLLDIDRENNAFGFATAASDVNTVHFGVKAYFDQGAAFDDDVTFEQDVVFNGNVTFNQGGGAVAHAPNLLDNSYFANLVNQGISGSDFVFDRWHGDYPVTINSGVGITIPSGGTIWQILPTDFRSTGTFTLAAMDTSGTIYSLTGEFANNPSSGPLAMASGYKVILSEGSYKWIALYEGTYASSSLPPYSFKGYAAELAECKRYCQELYTAWGCGHYSAFYTSSTSSRYRRAYIGVPITPMRQAIPTIVTDTARFSVYFDDNSGGGSGDIGLADSTTIRYANTNVALFTIYFDTGSSYDTLESLATAVIDVVLDATL